MTKFDELNRLSGVVPLSAITWKQRSMPYERYFGEMELTDEQKEERTQIAREFESMMLFLFSLLGVMTDYEYSNMEFVVGQVENRYIGVLGNYIEVDDYLRTYVREFAENTVNNTTDNSNNNYYMSEDRAVFVAENEANTVFNYSDNRKAIRSGATHKEWVAIRDKRTRDTHKEADGETIPIDEPFVVGSSLMDYPKDDSYGADPAEIVNCRCSVRYIGKKNTKVNLKNGKDGKKQIVNTDQNSSVNDNDSPYDFMGLPKRFSNEKISIKAYKVDGKDQIYTQAYSEDARKTIEFMQKMRNEGITDNLMDVVVAKELNGIAAYDHVNTVLYVNEKLTNAVYAEQQFSTGYFAAENAVESIKHEMFHKKHWDFILSKGSDSATIKHSLESDLHKYVSEAIHGDLDYLKKIVSGNAQKGYMNNGSLNETIADMLLQEEKGIVKDRELLRLVRGCVE